MISHAISPAIEQREFSAMLDRFFSPTSLALLSHHVSSSFICQALRHISLRARSPIILECVPLTFAPLFVLFLPSLVLLECPLSGFGELICSCSAEVVWTGRAQVYKINCSRPLRPMTRMVASTDAYTSRWNWPNRRLGYFVSGKVALPRSYPRPQFRCWPT